LGQENAKSSPKAFLEGKRDKKQVETCPKLLLFSFWDKQNKNNPISGKITLTISSGGTAYGT